MRRLSDPSTSHPPLTGFAAWLGRLAASPRCLLRSGFAGCWVLPRQTWLLLVTAVLSCVLAAPDARAEDAGADPFNHEEQVGFRVGFTLPYKVNFRFDDSPPCGTRNPVEEKKVCPVAAPVALDLALSYALTGSVEPFFWLRFGLADESKTSTEAATLAGAGLRLYTTRANQFKMYLQPAVAAEFEGPTVSIPGRNWETDFVMQVHLGGQFDFNRYVGAYLSVGPTVAVVRALSLGVEGSLGVQARFP